MKARNRNLYARLLAGAATVALTAGAAHAEQAKFDIPAQPLGAALRAFSVQSGHSILGAGALADSKTSHGVSGPADVDAALVQVLADTGLSYKKTDDTYLIVAGGESEGGNVVQELVVTAQKKSENIQVVPIAISAFTQQDLTTRQVAGGPDLMTQVPNMTFTKTNFTSYSIQIRGIGTQAISATTDPGVAVAFNNTPFIRNRFFEQEFYDLERIEVLRGPQGTLYGRNATAGVVNIISAKPKFEYEAKASADVGNYSSKRLEGMINIPLVEDKVALRLAGAWTKRDGYDTNQITGNPIDGRDLWSTRASLRFAPNDRIDANLVWEHFEENDDRIRSGKQLCKKDLVTEIGGYPVSFTDFVGDAGQISGWPVQAIYSQGCARESLYSPDSFQTPNGLSVPYYFPLSYIGLPAARFDPYASLVQSRDLRVVESIVDPKYKAKTDLGELQVKWDLTDSLTLASETAYNADFVWSTQDFNRFNTAPGAWSTNGIVGDAFTANNIIDDKGFFCDPQVGCSNRLVAIDLSTGTSRQLSQELRLSSDFGGPFNFSIGANFLRFDGVDKYYVFINSLTLSQIGDRSSAFDPFSTPGTRAPWIPGVSDNHECSDAILPGDPNSGLGYACVFIEPNSIENIQDQGHNYFLSKNPYRLISYAVFGEAYYNIADNLKLTAGLRWTVDKKHAPRIPSWTFVGAGTRGYPVAEVIDQEWREPTGRLAIDWKPDLGFTDETLLYASYAHGYKAGGANPPPMVLLERNFFGGVHPSETRPKTFDAEFVNAFELGAKNTLLDGKATVNLTAFYYDYTGYQVSEIVDRSAYNRNFDATIWGLELETDWRPLKNLKIGLKGGYEKTRIADGERAIDLMDRTAGHSDWVLIRPFPTYASSCVLPMYVYVVPGAGAGNVGSQSGGGPGGCELAYLKGLDPRTNLPYVPNPTVTNNSGGRPLYPGYPGFNPLDDTQGNNFGEGFFKDLGGNELPNAPHWTGTLTGDYTVPLPHDWLVTLHTDVHWQSQSWWRVFNDNVYDKLHPYFTMNLAAIFTNEEAGWNIMAYVKNVTNETAITGAFLNSDDTGLTTNVFLTEPRLYGLRVTKTWTGGSLLGSFGSRHEGPYPFTLEIGGQVQRHEAKNGPIVPSFLNQFSDALNPLEDQDGKLDWGDGRDVKVTWRPGGDWKFALGARFGKTNRSVPWVSRSEEGDRACGFALSLCEYYQQHDLGDLYIRRTSYTTSSATQREHHAIIDFTVGREVGFGGLSNSWLSAGLRHADLGSDSDVHIFGATNWDIPYEENAFKYPDVPVTHDRYDATISARRDFKGIGPVVEWAASRAILGGRDTGVLGVDWSVSGGVLFGKRKVSVSGTETTEYFSQSLGGPFLPMATTTQPVRIERSESVTVPTFGASLGLSYNIDRVSIGAGYRWERYQDAIDGGYSETREEDRTIDGPYLKVSVGFGG